jgi:signal transduction histidine kinase
MYRITSDYDSGFEQKVRELLALGRVYLGVQSGFLSEISDGTQLIVEASGSHRMLQSGDSCPLSKAYCRRTIEQEDALTVQHAALEGWENDAAYDKFGLESYIGAKVVVEGEVYGTFCFAGEEPRDQPFTEQEETFVELMAEWVSYELFQQRASKRIERQRDQLEEFASVVSHDLRNPLGVVQGYLDLAEQTGDPEHFDRCRNALGRMEALIDDLLVLAREGQPIGETESIDVAEIVRDCWELVPTEDATLEISDSAVFTGDWSRVQQLFENLLRNAVEHGGRDVTVRIGVLDGGSGIYFEDDGPGIPEEEREQIFADGYSTGQEGSGFGLSIVQQIARAHTWDVRVTESATGGARFEVTGVEIET